MVRTARCPVSLGSWGLLGLCVACAPSQQSAAPPHHGVDASRDAESVDAAQDASPDRDALGDERFAPADATADVTGDGGFIPVAPGDIVSGSGFTTETTVAATDAGRVAVAWIDFDLSAGRRHIGYAISLDSGRQFSPPVRMIDPAGRSHSVDPVLAPGADGSVYLTWIAFNRVGQSVSNVGLYVARSAPGTSTFGAPVEVASSTDKHIDKPWLTEAGGALLVSYFSEATQGLHVARADAFSQPFVTVDLASGARNLAYLCSAPDTGDVYAVYCTLSPEGPGYRVGIALRSSADGGRTWSAETPVSSPDERASYDDPTCVAAGDRVWVSYGVSDGWMTGTESTMLSTGVRVAASSDRGDTFALRMDAHDPSPSPDAGGGPLFMLPQMTRTDTGRLILSYYQGAYDGDVAGTFRRTTSVDDASFGQSQIVASGQRFTASRSSVAWLGDYTGIAWKSGTLHLSFASNRDGTSKIAYFQGH